jgi:hypothetical protein
LRSPLGKLKARVAELEERNAELAAHNRLLAGSNAELKRDVRDLATWRAKQEGTGLVCGPDCPTHGVPLSRNPYEPFIASEGWQELPSPAGPFTVEEYEQPRAFLDVYDLAAIRNLGCAGDDNAPEG